MVDLNARPKRIGWQLTGISAFLFFFGLFIMNTGNSSSMIATVIAAAMTTVLAVISSFRLLLSYKRGIEEKNALEFHKSHGNTELFGDADEAVRIATRNDQQFIKYFVPIATALLGLILGIILLVVWFGWKKTDIFPVAPNPLPMAILSFCCCIATLIGGSYFIGVSREQGCRWLRPGSAWLFLTGFLFLLSSIAFFCEYFKKATLTIDLTMGKVGIIILGLLAIELLLSFVIEFYRPRMPGEEERPLPESRLLSLFTEPGGLAKNVAASLDYQFGFRVSEAWFYRFIERTMVPLLVVMVIAFWFQTCLVVISPSETGLRQRFGRVLSQQQLSPGVYFKLPYPFESIYRFSSEKVQEIAIGGHEEDHGKEKEEPKPRKKGDHDHDEQPEQKEDTHDERIVVWDIKDAHGTEADFLVMDKNIMSTSIDVDNQEVRGVGILTAHIPLYFKVNDLYKYTYNTQNPSKTLQCLARRELLDYLLKQTWQGLLGDERAAASDELKTRIQTAADELDMGIEVVFVALTGLHPPKGTGASFDAVTSSMINRQRMNTEARSYSERTKSIANTAVTIIINQANAYKTEKETQAAAEESRFAGQAACFDACPRMFTLNNYYDALLQEGAKARKFVMLDGVSDEVLWLNLERKAKNILTDINLGN